MNRQVTKGDLHNADSGGGGAAVLERAPVNVSADPVVTVQPSSLAFANPQDQSVQQSAKYTKDIASVDEAFRREALGLPAEDAPAPTTAEPVLPTATQTQAAPTTTQAPVAPPATATEVGGDAELRYLASIVADPAAPQSQKIAASAAINAKLSAQTAPEKAPEPEPTFDFNARLNDPALREKVLGELKAEFRGKPKVTTEEVNGEIVAKAVLDAQGNPVYEDGFDEANPMHRFLLKQAIEGTARRELGEFQAKQIERQNQSLAEREAQAAKTTLHSIETTIRDGIVEQGFTINGHIENTRDLFYTAGVKNEDRVETYGLFVNSIAGAATEYLRSPSTNRPPHEAFTRFVGQDLTRDPKLAEQFIRAVHGLAAIRLQRVVGPAAQPAQAPAIPPVKTAGSASTGSAVSREPLSPTAYPPAQPGNPTTQAASEANPVLATLRPENLTGKSLAEIENIFRATMQAATGAQPQGVLRR